MVHKLRPDAHRSEARDRRCLYHRKWRMGRFGIGSESEDDRGDLFSKKLGRPILPDLVALNAQPKADAVICRACAGKGKSQTPPDAMKCDRSDLCYAC